MEDIWMDNQAFSFTTGLSPIYFIRALKRQHYILLLYYILYAIFVFWLGQYTLLSAAFCFFILSLGSLLMLQNDIASHWQEYIYAALIIAWQIYSLYKFGWNCGASNFFIPVLISIVFSLESSMVAKWIFSICLVIFRLGIFFYCQTYTPVCALDRLPLMILQVLNTLLVFSGILSICFTFSANIQKTEKHLLLYNIELRKQVATDPLTSLFNRRRILEIMESHHLVTPKEPFSIAMGDIDSFKAINDTYGHNCGDAVLKALSSLFVEKTMGHGHVCRWGGEEFLFFFPNMNLDQATAIMEDIRQAVLHLNIPCNTEILKVSMTFGVEEYDFHSTIQELVQQADAKLYYGKTHGKNRVIF